MSTKDLKPYLSVALFAKSRNRTLAAAAVLRGVLDVLGQRAPGARRDAKETTERTGKSGAQAGLELAWVHYVEERSPSWYPNGALVDRLNHLVVVAKKGHNFAVLCSDGGLRDTFVRAVDRAELNELVSLKPLAADVIRREFVEDRVRTIWLSGTHRRTETKPDSKTLSGLALETAIDPLRDQSYYYSSVRSTLSVAEDATKKVVGASPDRSRVWIGPTSSWEDFVKGVEHLLDRAARNSQGTTTSLSKLAAPTSDLGSIYKPYDMALIPESPSTGVDTEPNEELAFLENSFDEVRFDILPNTKGLGFQADVHWRAERLGRVSYDFEDGTNGRAKLKATKVDGFEGARGEAKLATCTNPDHLTIYFDSGHTFSRSRFYQTMFSDVRFERWRWVSMAKDDTQLDREKPLDGQRFAVERVGDADDFSLFGLVVRHWPNLEERGAPKGWLVCDDGAGEVADFVHIDIEKTPPVVTLIHAKGSGSKNSNRGISVSDYEVVVSQAVKNLRHLDRTLLKKKLEAAAAGPQKGADAVKASITSAVWHDGKRQADRSGLLDALGKLGSNYDRQVCILQPSVRRKLWNELGTKIHTKPDHAQVRRLRQLDALLLGAQSDFFGMGADFSVISDDDTQHIGSKDAPRKPRRKTKPT